MKRLVGSRRFFAPLLLVLGCAMFTPVYSRAQNSPPSGQWTNSVSTATNLVWDVNAISPGTNVEASVPGVVDVLYPISQDQTATGKIFGSGTNTVTFWYMRSNTWVNLTFPGSYQVTGSIVGGRGVFRYTRTRRLSGKGMIAGINRSVISTVTDKAVLSNISGSSTNLQSVIVSASGLVPATWLYFQTNTLASTVHGDGSWTLTMNLSPTNNNVVLGNATVTLNSGRVFRYAAKGVYKSTTQQTKLVLTGTNSSKGSVLQVLMNTNAVVSIKGNISGQLVNVNF